MNCTAMQFIRDNTNGNLVVEANTRKDGGRSYKMKSGWTNVLSASESKKLADFCTKEGFKIRYKKGDQS